MNEADSEQDFLGEIASMRAQRLQDLGRTGEALESFGEALSKDPNNVRLLQMLAQCQMRAKDPETALATAERALSLRPQEFRTHVLKASILEQNGKLKEARECAEAAIALEPEEPMCYSALASVELRAEKWAASEKAAKQALALDAEEEVAANILAHALFSQGKQVENEVHIKGLLQQDPEDPYTHYAAGLASLQAEEFGKAEEHFSEALRLDANFEPAREGLLDAFRSRSIIYRLYLRYCFFMTRLSQRQRWVFIIGLMVAVQVLFRSLSGVTPNLAMGLVGLYLIFAVWSYVAKPVGSLIVFGDRRARMALRPRERLEALSVGLVAVTGLAVALLGFVMGFHMMILGVAWVGMAMPLVLSLRNEKVWGRIYYGGLAALCLLGAVAIAWDRSIGVWLVLGAIIVGSWSVAFKLFR